MSAREEKIAEEVFSICMTEFSTDLIHEKAMCKVVREQIAKVLEGYAEEVRNTTHCKVRCGCFAYEQAIKEGEAKGYIQGHFAGSNAERDKAYMGEVRNIALEEAAKIAEEGPGPAGVVHCDGDVRDPGVVVSGFQKWIADRIRSLKSEAKK